MPKTLDIAYKLKENTWNGNTNVELEIVGVRLPEISVNNLVNHVAVKQNKNTKKAQFNYQGRIYVCVLQDSPGELRIRNPQGKVLAIGLLGTKRDNAKQVDVTQPHYYKLIKAALSALKTQ